MWGLNFMTLFCPTCQEDVLSTKRISCQSRFLASGWDICCLESDVLGGYVECFLTFVVVAKSKPPARKKIIILKVQPHILRIHSMPAFRLPISTIHIQNGFSTSRTAFGCINNSSTTLVRTQAGWETSVPLVFLAK